MLREILTQFRALRAPRATRPVLTAAAVAIVGATVAACGIKGPLRLPPPAVPAAAPATAPAAPAKPGETQAAPAPPAAGDAPVPTRQ